MYKEIHEFFETRQNCSNNPLDDLLTTCSRTTRYYTDKLTCSHCNSSHYTPKSNNRSPVADNNPYNRSDNPPHNICSSKLQSCNLFHSDTNSNCTHKHSIPYTRSHCHADSSPFPILAYYCISENRCRGWELSCNVPPLRRLRSFRL